MNISIHRHNLCICRRTREPWERHGRPCTCLYVLLRGPRCWSELARQRHKCPVCWRFHRRDASLRGYFCRRQGGLVTDLDGAPWR